jgi:hypothetical protein
MEMAIHQNTAPCHFLGITLPFTPAPYGLQGTRGARYGPIAVWLDQILLTITHNPIVMVAIRAGLVAAITAISLFWLCKTLRVSPWLAVAVMLSPWLYFYARQLWDNSLAIPVSALFLAAYADFLSTRRTPSLHLAIFCAPILILIHFMTIPLVVAVGLHLVIAEFRSLWRFKWSIVAILVVLLGISWPYWSNLFHGYHHNIPGGTSSKRGWIYPLLGPHHLSSIGLGNIYGDHWKGAAPDILGPAEYISGIAYLVAWLGMLLAIPSLFRVAFRSNRTSATDHIYSIIWIAVVFQCLLYGPLHVYNGPHYFNASWICFALLAFLSARYLPRWCAGILWVYCAAQMAILIIVAISVHHNGGRRSDNYGTALRYQIAAIREIQKYAADTPRKIEISEWTEHPQTPAVLEMLLPPPSGPKLQGNLLVRFRDAFLGDARIDIVNLRR